MINRLVKVTALFLVLMISLSSSALAYKKVRVYMPQTPEIELHGVKKIAVLDFRPTSPGSAEAGRYIADKMIEYILTEDRGIREIKGGLLTSDIEGKTLIKGLTTKCFSVVERSRLESVLAEQSMTDLGLVDDAQAAKLGKILGVDVLIYGDVSDVRQDKTITENRSRNGQRYTVYCTVREVTISASMRVVDTETGEIIGTKRLSQKADDKACQGSGATLRDGSEMAGTCASNLAWFFTNQINPWYAVGEFELDKIKAKEFKDEAKDAAEAAEGLEIDRAYAIYKKLYDSDPYNPKFLYNMGVMYEVAGSFEKAKEMYEGAAMLKDEDKYKEAAERIENRVKLLPFYASMDLAIEPFDFEAAASDASLTAQIVKVKGGSGDRTEVYSEPSESSEVEAKVPGGVQFEVVEANGDWYLIKLLGGKQGYIHKDRVDD